ncbi:sulfurtransferase [Truepera radiovictrix]|uniref:Rhodanese domain protein n=1 Tax=Truepera radiovictrix (strain DSM 17093 / CIP 108686 / LMG 22925 / RQ-24) TaxID=649638 RepID=D7CRV5_TRURR|nr:sulfurtransferase [Truepera radiovictrix]ADI15283.1 Rhodanese domain protein [Truepera radiovictrix DSM 17093]WMT56165.1 sulfurtransferase [Truepera radiovictrix]
MSASTRYSHLVQAAELRALLQTDAQVRLVDVRFSLTDPLLGRRRYEAGHLPGAVYLSLDDDLSGPVREHGGRHPLPDTARFAQTLGACGIGNDTHVVAYDDAAGGGMFAARLWWLLRYVGHDQVQVLDGGLDAWTAAGLELTRDVPTYPPATFTPAVRPEMVADMQEVRSKLRRPGVLLLDARAPERYRGEVEPLDKRAGHIPGARNRPFMGNLEGGRFKPAEALRARFADVEAADETILYCGSGVSAAHNALALEEAGLRGAKLYVGSWSDWSSFEENPVATGEEA